MLTTKHKKIEGYLITLIFCMLVSLPLIEGVLTEDKKVSKIEKRKLNPLPALPQSIQEFVEFPSDFTNYYADHFGFRKALNREYIRLSQRISVQSSADDVTLGKNDWLFLGSIKPGYQKNGDPMGDVININQFSEASLDRFIESKKQIRDWLKGYGIGYLYFVAPNKHTIYFDQLPSYITKKNELSAFDQLLAALTLNNISTFDIRDALFEKKKTHQIYYKYDTHWNHFAGNQVQFRLAEKINDLYPDQIDPTLLDDSQFTNDTIKTGDLARFAKIGGVEEADPQPVFESSCVPRKEIQSDPSLRLTTFSCDTGKLKALVFRDSFFTVVEPYTARYFARSTYIWKPVSQELLQKYVSSEKPDIVIEEMVERWLPYTPTLFSEK